MATSFLSKVVVLMLFAVLIVLIFKKLRLSSVLGYLIAGAIIGEHGLNFSSYSEVHIIAEFGVVLLLFMIGLELSFERLKQMSKYVFGLGSLQLVLTSIALFPVMLLAFNDVLTASISAIALALSSTAIVLKTLDDTKNQSTKVGRICISVLILQDFAVVPLLIVIPMIASKGEINLMYSIGSTILKASFTLISIFILGRIFLKPTFKFISSGSQENNEIFIASTILVVLSAAYATEYMGLSMELGAFLAGIMVAETEFRVAAEKSIYPFKGILLGLFFMSVGMTIDMNEVVENIWIVLAISSSLVAIKAGILFVLCILFRFPKGKALHTGLMLAQGSEFAFILFELAGSHGIMDESISDVLLLVVTFTMAITPLLAIIGQKFSDMLDSSRFSHNVSDSFNGDDLNNHIVIGGYGTVGKVISGMLESESINYIAIEIDQKIVTQESKHHEIVKGDISQKDVLETAGIKRCIAFVISVDNFYTIKRSLKIMRENYPDVPVIVRVNNFKSSIDLLKSGASMLVPEDLETGLQLGGAILKSIGISENEINRLKSEIRLSNYNFGSRNIEDLDDIL